VGHDVVVSARRAIVAIGAEPGKGSPMRLRAPLLFAALVALCGAAAAQGPRLAGGAWSGAYTCSQGLTGMTVTLAPRDAATADAVITFYAHPDNPGVESGCYEATGRYDAASGRLVLTPGRWIYKPGDGWRTTMLDGRLGADGVFAGRVIAPGSPSACTTFTLRRGAAPLKAPAAQCARPALVG
jgi:hypothetical protein